VTLTYTADVSADFGLGWNVAGPVSRDFEMGWNVYGYTYRDFDMTWAVYTAVEADCDIQWNVYTHVSPASFDIQWNVEANLTDVAADYDLEWHTIGWIYADFTFEWATQEGLLLSVVTMEFTTLKNTDIDYDIGKHTDLYLEVEA